MRLADLTKPQWDAALNAARILRSGDPMCRSDRYAFREATAELDELMPAGTDTREIISQVMRWAMVNDACAELQNLFIHQEGSGVSLISARR